MLVYFAHASSLRLRSAGAHFVRRPVGLASALRALEWNSSRRYSRLENIVLYRSRQQPSAALRWGALRATAGRPCLSTFVLRRGGQHCGRSGSENGPSEARISCSTSKMKKTRKAVAHLRVSSIANPGPFLPQAAVRRYISSPVGPATSFQIHH